MHASLDVTASSGGQMSWHGLRPCSRARRVPRERVARQPPPGVRGVAAPLWYIEGA